MKKEIMNYSENLITTFWSTLFSSFPLPILHDRLSNTTSEIKPGLLMTWTHCFFSGPSLPYWREISVYKTKLKIIITMMPVHFLWEKFHKIIILIFIALVPFLSCIISHSYLPSLWFTQSNRLCVSQTHFCVFVQRNSLLICNACLLILVVQVPNSARKQNKTEQNLSPLKSLRTLPEHLFYSTLITFYLLLC